MRFNNYTPGHTSGALTRNTMKDPAVLFYTSDFLSGVTFLNMEQRGQYITLLCEQHQHGSIPENHMINICGSLDSPVLKKFERDEGGNYYNPRMRYETNKRKMYCESRKNNKAGRKKKESYVKSYDKHMINHMGNENINENSNVITINNTLEIAKKINEWAKGYFHEKYISEGSLDVFEKLIRIDGYQENDIRVAIEWARSDDFWSTNFLSPVKLRSKDKNGVKYIDVFLAKTIKRNGKQASRKGATWEDIAEVASTGFDQR